MAKAKPHITLGTCLITGGYGLIGSALANATDGKVAILVRSERHKERIKKEDIKVIKKDLLDITKKDVRGVDVIYHCASTVDNYHILDDPYIDIETNIRGTIKLLEACKGLTKKPKVVFFSTFFVYGNEYDRSKTPINEESKTEPLALYPATKLCAESVIKLYSRLYGIDYIICRLTNVYHESEDFTNKKKGALNFIIMQAVKGEPLYVYEGGNFCRDYIYLEDVVSAVKFLVSRKIKNETFLVGFGKPVLFGDIIDYIHELTGRRSALSNIEPPEFHKVVGIINFVASTEKINRLGWKAKVDYREGIEKVVSFYQRLYQGVKPN